MTQQATDRMIYDGRKLPVNECPLDDHKDAQALSKRFVMQGTDNWRGYIATWMIQDGWLCLAELSGYLRAENREAELSDFAPGHVSPLVASWFTGTLHVGDGRRIGSEYEYGPDIYERTIRLTIQSGQLQASEIIQNGTAPERPEPEWPRRRWFPITQEGHSEYMNRWLAQRRKTPLLANVPLHAIEDHRAAVALAKERGWRDLEEG